MSHLGISATVTILATEISMEEVKNSVEAINSKLVSISKTMKNIESTISDLQTRVSALDAKADRILQLLERHPMKQLSSDPKETE
ncbi:hypothetical protein MMC34_008034 [Xylographa carneopallida]|nr:hypothetical protein [Xylographa carneopallida]